jgi:membrane protease YdiL (CAAX protease family)
MAAAVAYLAVLPVALWLATRPGTCDAYPSPAFPPARAHALGLVFLWLLHHVPQLFSVEAFFRGFLFLPLARRLGFVPVVVGLGAVYTVLHVQPTKPPLEALLAAWGGVVFMTVAWRWQSFLPGFLAHLAIAVTIDLVCFAAIPAAGSR